AGGLQGRQGLMEIIIQPTPEAASPVAADIVAVAMRGKADRAPPVAPRPPPLRLYQDLIARSLDWRTVRTFNLDEYVGLPREHPESFHSVMWANLFQHVNITPSNVHIPDGLTPDVPAHCAAYEAAIRAAGGIDVQVLGIGTDGHI